MSKIKVTQPVVHTPSFQEYDIGFSGMSEILQGYDFTLPMGLLDGWYYYTDADGWGKILFDMAFKSSLYKTDKFDCDNYALKAMSVCAERYGLNAFGVALGDTPLGYHAFNIFYDGEEFMLFEPNDGFPFAGSAFRIGENEYIPKMVIL